VLVLTVRLASQNAYLVFEDDAIQFAARKAASVSGDIRKALHICKAAAEAVMQEVEAGTRVDPKRGRGRPIVRISDVQKASRESFSSVMSTAVASSTSLQALLLVSLASLTRTTGRNEGGFDINELMTKMEAVSGSSGDPQYSPPPTFGETLEMLNRLGEVSLKRSSLYHHFCRISANLYFTALMADTTCLTAHTNELQRHVSCRTRGQRWRLASDFTSYGLGQYSESFLRHASQHPCRKARC
jgi:Cdc6-like AAA superfamily ATPase